MQLYSSQNLTFEDNSAIYTRHFEVTDNAYNPLKALADDLGLKIVQFCLHLWVDTLL